MNPIRQGLSSRLRRRTTAKQWCIINERRMNSPNKANRSNAEKTSRSIDPPVAADPIGAGTASGMQRLILIGARENYTTLERVRAAG
jgi:hypothetical protein